MFKLTKSKLNQSIRSKLLSKIRRFIYSPTSVVLGRCCPSYTFQRTKRNFKEKVQKQRFVVIEDKQTKSK
ncbi:unnamed protein product [Cylicocyclus nassatus]|uniref:Uncharacterized protein n=1 Tax=Cylicocyclus nassatus TaxID=53992 RepID=A0AA36H049_CYLNA|nr:unnamed protein product [Cylicocyclus nassatus]